MENIRELILNYAKNMFRSHSIDELWLLEVLTEAEFKLNYDEKRDNGINHETFIRIVKTCMFLKENVNYSVFNEDSFFKAFEFHQLN